MYQKTRSGCFLVGSCINKKREFSDTNFEVGKPCRRFDWMLLWYQLWDRKTLPTFWLNASLSPWRFQSKCWQGFPISKLVSENSLFLFMYQKKKHTIHLYSKGWQYYRIQFSNIKTRNEQMSTANPSDQLARQHLHWSKTRTSLRKIVTNVAFSTMFRFLDWF